MFRGCAKVREKMCPFKMRLFSRAPLKKNCSVSESSASHLKNLKLFQSLPLRVRVTPLDVLVVKKIFEFLLWKDSINFSRQTHALRRHFSYNPDFGKQDTLRHSLIELTSLATFFRYLTPRKKIARFSDNFFSIFSLDAA